LTAKISSAKYKNFWTAKICTLKV